MHLLGIAIIIDPCELRTLMAKAEHPEHRTNYVHESWINQGRRVLLNSEAL